MTIKHIIMSADEELQNRFVEFAFAEQIADHEEGRCSCDLPDFCECENAEECECNTDGMGLCYLGQWCEGCTDAEQVILGVMDDDCMTEKFRLLYIYFPQVAQIMIDQANMGRPRRAHLFKRPTWEEYVASLTECLV